MRIGSFEFARDLRLNRELLPVAATVLGSVALNMAVGFVAGVVAHDLLLRTPRGPADAQ